MANPIQLCTNCDHFSPINWKKCHNCSNEFEQYPAGKSYESISNYYYDIENNYHIYSLYSNLIGVSLALPVVPLFILHSGPYAIYPALYLWSSTFFLSFAGKLNPCINNDKIDKNPDIKDYISEVIWSAILAIPIIYIFALIGPYFNRRTQGKVSHTEAIDSLLEVAADGQLEATVTAFTLLASIKRPRIRIDDMDIFYRFVEEHPDIIFTQIRSDQLFAVVSKLYGDLSGPKRQEIVELLAESSDGQYTQDKIEMEIKRARDLREDSLINSRLKQVPERMPDETCNARRHDDGQFLGYCDRTAGWGTDSEEGRCRTHRDGTPEQQT